MFIPNKKKKNCNLFGQTILSLKFLLNPEANLLKKQNYILEKVDNLHLLKYCTIVIVLLFLYTLFKNSCTNV